jgi:hypothetical protein
MGLYHSVDIVYGIEIPTDTDFDALYDAANNQPNPAERINYIVVGDNDRLILAAHIFEADENTVTALTPDFLTRYEAPAWDKALHAMAARVGCSEHPQPGWLLIHNYR